MNVANAHSFLAENWLQKLHGSALKRRPESPMDFRLSQWKKESGFMMIVLLLESTFWIAEAHENDTVLSGSPSLTVSQPSSAQPQLAPVPHPDLERLEPLVRRQIQSAQNELTALTKNKLAAAGQLAIAYGELGKLYQAYDFVDAALVCYENAQALAPEDYRWNYYLAHLYQGEGRLDKASDYLKRALEKRPDDTAALLKLAAICFDQNDSGVAETLFQRVAKLNGRSAPALAGLGRIELSRKQFDRAVRYFEAALEVDPGASSLHYPLAMAYRNLGDAQKAQIHLSKTGQVKPQIPDPLIEELQGLKKGRLPLWFQGNEAMQAGRFAEAAEAYRQMSDSDPSDPMARMYYGTALAQAGNTNEAIQQFVQALRQAPQNAGLHYNLGIVLLQRGSEVESLKHFQAAVDSDPSFKQANFQLANLSMRHGRFADSEQSYARVIQQEPANSFARLMQVMALVRLKRYPEARRLLDDGLKALPNDPDLTHALARLLAACPLKSVRDGRRALELSQKLLKAEKNLDFERVQTLSMAMAEAGQFDQATQLLRSVIAKLKQLQRSDLSRLLEGQLVLFEQGKASRVPWRDDDPVFFPVPGSLMLITPQQLSPMQAGAAN